MIRVQNVSISAVVRTIRKRSIPACSYVSFVRLSVLLLLALSIVLLQALAPLLLIVVPFTTALVVMLNGTKDAEAPAFVTTALYWIPALNPLTSDAHRPCMNCCR